MSSLLESGNQPPSWVQWLGNDTVRTISCKDENESPIGCHYFYDSDADMWEISVFAAATEIIGGPLDGTRFSTPVTINLSAFAGLFDSTPEVRPASDPRNTDQRPSHVSCEGRVRGRTVWLRVLKNAPDEVEPGRILHSDNGHVETLW